MSSFLKTGQMIAMKPAGGTHTSKQTLHYLMMVKEELGEEWLSNHWFRFGASSLANDILIVAERGERALPEYGSLLCGSGPERAGPAPLLVSGPGSGGGRFAPILPTTPSIRCVHLGVHAQQGGQGDQQSEPPL
ncbi:MAG: hypothetical protein IPH05_12650 [Flavobacteriales bacterium]|nr:hypothetical protein [Flavobacteriales bacterium]